MYRCDYCRYSGSQCSECYRKESAANAKLDSELIGNIVGLGLVGLSLIPSLAIALAGVCVIAAFRGLPDASVREGAGFFEIVYGWFLVSCVFTIPLAIVTVFYQIARRRKYRTFVNWVVQTGIMIGVCFVAVSIYAGYSVIHILASGRTWK